MTLENPTTTSQKFLSLKQKLVLKTLEKIHYGSLTLIGPDGQKFFFKGPNEGPEAHWKLNTWKVFDRAISHGDIGFGEDYIENNWQTDDLVNLLLFFLKNESILAAYINGNKLFQVFAKLKSLFNKNTRKGSANNIHHHYDLGNEFYSLWLDESMTYSSGIFTAGESLEQAQNNKYQRILNEVLKVPQEHLLEIGCGWGGFCEKAALEGLKVDAITISKAQAEFAQQRIERKKLNQYVTFKLQDYRDVRQQFTSIVSIEMFEAVGYEYWKDYFKMIQQNLKRSGKAIIQTITIADDLFDSYRKRLDFIQKHIFPGGILPSKQFFKIIAQKCGLEVIDEYAFGLSYAKTLREWLDRFENSLKPIQLMGYSEDFIRKWQFYLAYCLAGFASQRTDVVQYQLVHKD
jgi:cyclopropane-fatty-acyl-phospholipid synthase